MRFFLSVPLLRWSLASETSIYLVLHIFIMFNYNARLFLVLLLIWRYTVKWTKNKATDVTPVIPHRDSSSSLMTSIYTHILLPLRYKYMLLFVSLSSSKSSTTSAVLSVLPLCCSPTTLSSLTITSSYCGLTRRGKWSTFKVLYLAMSVIP